MLFNYFLIFFYLGEIAKKSKKYLVAKKNLRDYNLINQNIKSMEVAKLKIRKLSWAGAQVLTNDKNILIDPLHALSVNQSKPFVARLGESKEDIYSLQNLEMPDAILITHTHPDHFDYKGIIKVFGLNVALYAPKAELDFIKKLGFSNVIGVELNQEFNLSSSVKIFSTYSIDGFGASQIAWIVESNGKRIIHCGDTLWHGYWWKIADRFGEMDCTLMPVNAPILEVKGLKYQSSLPATLSPEEAIEATKILGAKKMIPIHFNTFNNPPYYIETEGIRQRLEEYSLKYDISVPILKPGEYMNI